MVDDTTEADYMHSCQMAELGAETGQEAPTHEVVNSKNKQMFSGSRSDCWAFKKKRGGFVRECAGADIDLDEWRI